MNANAIAAKVADDIRARVLFTECAATRNPAGQEARLFGLAQLADDCAQRFARKVGGSARAGFMRGCGFDTTAAAGVTS